MVIMDDVCFISGCDNNDVDQRGRIATRDGSHYHACTPHWEAIFGILGRQAVEARWVDTAARWRPELLEEEEENR